MTAHLVRKVDNGYVLSPEGIALMYDVPVADALDHLATVTVEGPRPIPTHWHAGFGRRCREAYAATGSTGLVDGLRYWAATYLGPDVVVLVDVDGNEIDGLP